MQAKWITKLSLVRSGKETRKKSALLVEREEICRSLLSSLLGEKGYKVKCSGNILEAINLVETTPFDLVITDHAEPVFDGLLLLKQIKLHDRQIRVLVIASQYGINERLEAVYLGALDYIKKPMDCSEFKRLVDTYC